MTRSAQGGRVGGAGGAAASSSPDRSTRRRIEEAALSLFAAKGFEATGIREIADRAGVASSALYHYVGSKDELLVEIMTSSMIQLIRTASQALEVAHDAPTQLAALVRTHVGFHAADPLRSRVSDDELRALTVEARARVMALRDRYEQLWIDVLERGVRAGSFRLSHDKITRLALLEMCNGVVHWYSPEGPMSPAEVADVMADLALSMVEANLEGRRVVLANLKCQPSTEILELVRRGLDEASELPTG